MPHKCTLVTEGFQITFNLSNPITEGWIETIVEFVLDPNLGILAIESIRTHLSIRDFQHLQAYFDQHIKLLQQDPRTDSEEFVFDDQDLLVRAFAGSASSDDEGEFRLMFLMNMSKTGQVYVGGEAAVTVTSVKEFMSMLRVGLDELAQSTGQQLA